MKWRVLGSSGLNLVSEIETKHQTEQNTHFFLRDLSAKTLEAADVTVIDEMAAASAVDADGLAYFDCFFFLSLALRLFSSSCQIVKR